VTPAEGRGAHPIEQESYRLVARMADLSGLGPLSRQVVARVIHASADLDYATSMVIDDEAVAAGIEGLRQGAPVVTDVETVRSALTTAPASCYLPPRAPGGGLTRAAAGMRLAARRAGPRPLVVVGCAPTALAEVVALAASGQLDPCLVVGMPVGFVGAAEAKEALRASGLASVSNRGPKGGSAVAAAAANAIVKLAGLPRR